MHFVVRIQIICANDAINRLSSLFTLYRMRDVRTLVCMMDTRYSVVTDGNALVARHPKHGVIQLRQTAIRDQYVAEAWFLEVIAYDRSFDGIDISLRVIRPLKLLLLFGSALACNTASLRADAIDESIRREMESSASVNQVPLDIFC